MKLKDMSKEELETMGYEDIAYNILLEDGKKYKLPVLFKKVCNLLELSDSEYEAKIGDFFQIISTDQRFTMLPKGYFDLKDNHERKINLIDDEEEITEEDITEDDIIDDELSSRENDTYYDEDSEDDDPEEDDLKDLVIVSDEEDEDNAI